MALKNTLVGGGRVPADEWDAFWEVCDSNPDMTIGEAIDAYPDVFPDVTSEPVDGGPLLVADYTDHDGYSYHAELLTASVAPERNVADAKPGQVLVQLYFTSEGSVTNTTDGRNAPSNGAVTPYWLAGSPLCSYPAAQLRGTICFVPNLGGSLYAAGSPSIDLKATSKSDPGTPSYLFIKLDVPEAEVEQLIADAMAPAGYVIYAEQITGSGCSIAGGNAVASTGPVALSAGC